MDMFQEGGVTLKDEGGEIEEVSGNEVPLGGVKEGVADDQPAQLSPGEMVLSEDVVRYHGVEKVMALRDEAKIGYHKMEAMGQLGNADEASIPTEAIFNPGGMPFSVVDLEYIDMDDDVDEAEAANGMYVQKMQTGGVVQSTIDPATGLPSTTAVPGTAPTSVSTPVVPTNIVTPPPATPTTMTTTPITTAPTAVQSPNIITPSAPVTQQPTVPGADMLPTGQQFLGGTQSVNYYINETGQVIQIPVVNGRQIYETPEGFQAYNPLNPQPFDPDLEEKEEETPVDVPSTLQQPPPDVGFGPDRGALPDGPAIDPDVDVGPTAGIDVGVSALGYTADGNRTANIFDFLADQNFSLYGKGVGILGQKATELTPEQIAANKKAYNEKTETLIELDRKLNPMNMTPSERIEFEKAVKAGKFDKYEGRVTPPTTPTLSSTQMRDLERDAAARAGGRPTPTAEQTTGFSSLDAQAAAGATPERSTGFSSLDAQAAAGQAAIDTDVGRDAGIDVGSAPDITPDSPDFKKGGLIEAQTGTLVPVQQPSATFSRINPETGLPETTAAPTTAVPQVLQPGTPAPITTGSALTPTTLSALTPTSTRVSAPDRPVGQQPPTTTPLPTGQQFLGGVQSTNFFINELGQVIQIPVVNGRQIYDEPKGFQPYDPSNPQPFDPDLEDDRTVTTPEQPQQRRRTITEREEGGQPDVGPGGQDTYEGLGFEEGNTFGSIIDGFDRDTETLGVERAAEIANAKAQKEGIYDLDKKPETWEDLVDQRNAVKEVTKVAKKFSPFATAVSAAEKAAAKAKRDRAYEKAAEASKSEANPAGLSGTGPGGFGVGRGEGGGLAGPGGDQSDTSESGTVDAPGLGADSPDGSMLNKGGLVSKKPKSKKKAKKKNNNRKGLASKKKY